MSVTRSEPVFILRMQASKSHCDPTSEEVRAAARRYAAAGRSIFPLISRDQPLFQWKPYQSQRASDEQLCEWYGNGRRLGIAIICGAISGGDGYGLEALDAEGRAAHLLPEIRDQYEEQHPGVWERLPMVDTPGGGTHSVYLSPIIEPGRKLATRPAFDADGKPILLEKSGKQKSDTWIETRAEGNYVCAPPSPASIHPSGRHYQMRAGDYCDLPRLTPDERNDLLMICASYHEPLLDEESEKHQRKQSGQSSGTRPGDDFNMRADWRAILEPHGWRFIGHRSDGVGLWQKPLSSDPRQCHATTGHLGDWLYVFSTATNLPHEKALSKFGAYALLNHAGNFEAAARDLSAQGYGEQRERTADSFQVKQPENESRPTDDILRDRWLEKHPDTLFIRDDFYRYADGLWLRMDKKIVRRELDQIICDAKAEKVRPTGSLLASVLTLSEAKTAERDEQFDRNPDYIVCRNGALHIPTLALEPHRKDLYATTGVNFDYDPKAERPNWDRYTEWLKLNISDDTEKNGAVVDFLQEFAGLCLTTEMKHELSVWLVGEPGGGKSTFVEGIKAAIRDRAVKLSLYEIAQRFGCADLPGKTLATCSEQPSDYLQSTCRLNEIISGETITVERKFHDPFEFNPTVKLLFAMNDPPRISDPNNGIFRRIAVVKIPAIAKEKRDPDLKERIKTEGPGILNWCLEGLKRLEQRGAFRLPASVTRATADYQNHSDVPGMFLEERTTRNPKPLDVNNPLYREQSSCLYRAYKNWCEDNGHKPVSSTRIAGDWVRLGLEMKAISGCRYWCGVRLNENAPIGADDDL